MPVVMKGGVDVFSEGTRRKKLECEESHGPEPISERVTGSSWTSADTGVSPLKMEGGKDSPTVLCSDDFFDRLTYTATFLTNPKLIFFNLLYDFAG